MMGRSTRRGCLKEKRGALARWPDCRLSGCAALVLASLSASCFPLILPVPTGRHTPQDAFTRDEIEEPLLEFLQHGPLAREEVLWRFGEPDVVSADERYFLYRWLSVSGYLVAGPDEEGYMGVERHDMVLEFDEQGVLVRFDEIEELVTKPFAEDAPVDAVPPLEFPVLHRKSALGKWGSAILRLDETRVTLRKDGVLDFEPTAITALEHGHDHARLWYDGWLTYRLHYERDQKERVILRLQVNVLDVPRLAKYVQTYSPTAVIH